MFKQRPYDRDGEGTRSDAAKAARIRNFRIFRLRGIHSQLGVLTGKRRERAMKIIDEELKAMGAETESARKAERDREYGF